MGRARKECRVVASPAPEYEAFWKEKLPNPTSVKKSFGSAVFQSGYDLFRGGKVEDIAFFGSRICGTVRPAKKAYQTVWEVTPKGLLKLECTCRQYAYCEHQIALFLEANGKVFGVATEDGTACSHRSRALKTRKRRKRRMGKRRYERRREILERSYPHLALSLKSQEICLQAELRSFSSDRRWPLDGVSCRLETDKAVYTCDTYAMKAMYEDLLYMGFEPISAGRYRMTDRHRLKDFLSVTLGYWLEEASVDLDERLQAFVRGESALELKAKIGANGAPDSFNLEWTLEASGERLTRKDLREIYSNGRGVLFTRSDKMVLFDSYHLREKLRPLCEIGANELGKRRRIPLHFLARAVDAVRGGNGRSESLEGVELSGKLKVLYRKLRHFDGIEETAPPGELGKRLRPYQGAGLSFLNFLSEYGFGGILADDMGLGKTVQALALVELKRREASQREPSLVVCPTSVASNWIEEVEKFTPDIDAIHLTSSPEIKHCNLQKYDLIVVSYALLRRNHFEQKFRYLILDEAQNIKNPKTKIAAAVKLIQCRHRLALTGTPIENSVMELWSIFDFLMPGYLGNHNHFRTQYEQRITRLGDRTRLEELARYIKPFLLRRLKGEVAKDLPPKTEQDIYSDLTPKQKRLYREVVANVRSELTKKIDKDGWEKSQIHVLSALTRLRQICCHPALWDPSLKTLGSGKLKAFLEILEAILAGGHKVVVFSQFVKMLRLLEEETKNQGIQYLYLDGGTRKRDRIIKRFQEDDEVRVFLMSLKAGGTGVNLTAANYVVLFDPWWNPAVENQAIDRIHRIGQDKPISAYRLLTRGTVEERLEELKQRKRDLAEKIIRSEAEVFKKLTREDLDFLLR